MLHQSKDFLSQQVTSLLATCWPKPDPAAICDAMDAVFAQADAAWDAQTDPGRRAAAPPPSMPSPTPKPSSSPSLQRETVPPLPSTSGATFNQARTAHEVAKAQKARIQVDRLKDEVVDRARATALVFKLARQERDSWVTWPARIAGQMAAEVGIETHLMQTLLETHVRAHLAELAEIEPTFR